MYILAHLIFQQPLNWYCYFPILDQKTILKKKSYLLLVVRWILKGCCSTVIWIWSLLPFPLTRPSTISVRGFRWPPVIRECVRKCVLLSSNSGTVAQINGRQMSWALGSRAKATLKWPLCRHSHDLLTQHTHWVITMCQALVLSFSFTKWGT